MTSSSKRSETSSVLKARAAAREAKLQVEMEALRQKELLEREELILRQRREEQKRELRQSIEEVEEQQRALKKSREEEIRKLQIQSQREEWEIINRKRILQKELDIKCAAIENDIINKISERSFSVSGQSKHKASRKFQLEPSTSKLEAPSTSKFEAISLAVSRPLPEQRHPADQPAEQVNFKPTVGFNVRPLATSEDELQASFQSVFPKLSKLPEPRKTPTSAPFVSSTSQMHSTSFLTPLHSQQQVIPSIASLKLPPVDMPTFSGEPIRYCQFINAFESIIENKEPDFRQCLYYLSQYTRGMAKDLVCSCLYIHDARDALQRAKMLLKENFGQPYQITSVFISKLTEGPSLATNNSSELSAFAIDLETCVITLKGIGCVNEINTQHVLRQIINRLPVPIQHKWRAVADNIMHEAKKNISIEDIVYFVRKQGRELNNPVFGVSVKKRVNNQKLFFASAVKSNTDSTKSCLMCLAPHYLNHC